MRFEAFQIAMVRKTRITEVSLTSKDTRKFHNFDTHIRLFLVLQHMNLLMTESVR